MVRLTIFGVNDHSEDSVGGVHRVDLDAGQQVELVVGGSNTRYAWRKRLRQLRSISPVLIVDAQTQDLGPRV